MDQFIRPALDTEIRSIHAEFSLTGVTVLAHYSKETRALIRVGIDIFEPIRSHKINWLTSFARTLPGIGKIVHFPVAGRADYVNFSVLYAYPDSLLVRAPRVTERTFDRISRILVESELYQLSRLHDIGTAGVLALLEAEGEVNPFERTLKLLVEMFRCRGGTIWEYHDNTDFRASNYLTLEAAIHPQTIQGYTTNCLPEGHGFIWKVVSRGAPPIQYIKKIRKEEVVNRHLYDGNFDSPAVLLRLETSNSVYGVVCLNGVHEFDLTTRNPILEVFCRVAAVEIHNKKLRQTRRLLERVTELVPLMNADQSRICNIAASNVREVLDCLAVSIFLREESPSGEPYLRLTAMSVRQGLEVSPAASDFRRGKIVYYGLGKNSLTSIVFETGTPILANQVSSHPGNSHVFREITDRSNDTWVGVPIIGTQGKAIGVIRCTGKLATISGATVNYIFDRADTKFLEQLSRVLSAILQSIRNYKSLEEINERLGLAEKIREHEMIGPLTAISYNADFVARYLDDSGATSRPRRLKEIISDVEMCSFLLREARLPPPQEFERRKSVVSVNLVVAELRNFLRRQVEARSELTASTDPAGKEYLFSVTPFMDVETVGAVPLVAGNRHLIQRAIYNLASNAVKYGRPHGTLKILLSSDDQKKIVYIDVEDNGIGIDDNDIPWLFTEGYRGGRVKAVYPGEGLGLFLSKKICELHGGTLLLTSARAPTRFRLSLPYATTDSAQDIVDPSILRFDPPRRISSK